MSFAAASIRCTAGRSFVALSIPTALIMQRGQAGGKRGESDRHCRPRALAIVESERPRLRALAGEEEDVSGFRHAARRSPWSGGLKLTVM